MLPDQFPTQAKLIDHIKSLRDKYPDGATIPGEDHAFLLALVQRHPCAAEKIGRGVHRFTVETDKKYKTRGFWLHRTDGSKTDFSYRECIRPSTHQSQVLAALREAVSEQMIKFREATFNGQEKVLCPITHQNITRTQAHVDHVYPQTFSQLVKDWSTQEHIILANIQLTEFIDGSIGRQIKDDYTRESFQWYHGIHAKLQVIEKRINISLSNKPR